MIRTNKIFISILTIILVGIGFLVFNSTRVTEENLIVGKCFIGGCSAEVCSDQGGMVSTCEYREEYACYKTATCERQSSGQCGWTETSELNSCLNNSPSIGASGVVSGHVTIGPNCPVEREGEPCETPPQAYSSREIIVYESDKTTIVKKEKIDSKGNYRIGLNSGNYFVQVSPAGIGPGEKKPVTIKAKQTTTLNFDIDTGIR